MSRFLFRAPIRRLFMLAALPIGLGAYASGVVSADICQAYKSGSVGASPGQVRPLLCS